VLLIINKYYYNSLVQVIDLTIYYLIINPKGNLFFTYT
jgi:hypothetical protein